MTFCPAELERFGEASSGFSLMGHGGAQADARRVDDVDLDALLVEFFLARPAVRIAEIPCGPHMSHLGRECPIRRRISLGTSAGNGRGSSRRDAEGRLAQSMLLHPGA